MSREIKFRAKFIMGINKGKWDYFTLGDLMETPSENFESWYDIETLGEYTGLKSRHGKEIYEGDIIEDWGFNGIEIIKFSHSGFEPSSSFVNYEKNIMTYLVIGNIYDNPELLTEKITNAIS